MGVSGVLIGALVDERFLSHDWLFHLGWRSEGEREGNETEIAEYYALSVFLVTDDLSSLKNADIP